MVVSCLVGSAVVFIQSRSFASTFKQVIFKYLPRDTGIEADFSEFAIKVFPPGISLKNPVITLRDKNILKMPGGSSVKAERIDFEFQPFQMLTGNIRIKELTLVDGALQLFYDPKSSPVSKSGPSRLSFHWDELLQVHAEAIGMQNMKVRVDWIGSTDYAELQVGSVRLAQWHSSTGLGYEVGADVTALSGSFIRQIPMISALDSVQLGAHVNEAGVTLDSLAVRGTGLSLSARGLIHGNVQKPKAGLNFDAEVQMSGELARVARAIGTGINPHLDLGGNFAFDGKARGNLEKFLETVKFDGKIMMNDLRYRHFICEHVDARGSWEASPQGGDLTIQEAVLSSPERSRAVAVTASGGKVMLSDLHYRIGSRDPVNVHVQLERASLQWLASLGLEDIRKIYPVEARLTGTLDATMVLGSQLSASSFKAQLKMKANGFQLDNQRMGEIKPLVKVFHAPEISLEGSTHLDQDGLHFEAVEVGLPRSKVMVNGSISLKTGFNLHGTGAVNLEDLGQIADNDVRGSGNIEVNVSGPPSRILVDVDSDLTDVYYLRMQYGSVKGRISWDDDSNHLLFQKVEGARGESHYTVNGVVDTGKHESVAVSVSVPKGTIQDFIVIFHDLTSELSWFPSTLTGPLSGSIDISGGLKIPELRILSHVNGTSWNYLGERFAKVQLVGGIDRGTYELSSFDVTKRTGRVDGKISFSAEDVLNWQLHGHQLSVGDIDHIARLDVPMKGVLAIDSTGNGKEGSVVSQTQISVSDLSVRGEALAPSQLSINTAKAIMSVHAVALGGQGDLKAKYDFNPTSLSTIQADFHRLDFSPMLLLLNPKTITDPALLGFVSGAVNLTFRSGMMDRASGSVSLSEYVLGKADTRMELARPVTLQMNDGTFDLPSIAITSKRGTVELSLKSRKAALDGNITGELDLSLIEFFTSAVSHTAGTAKLDLLVGGTLREPWISGNIVPSSPTIWVEGVESPFENITGEIQIHGNTLDVTGFDADLATGHVTGNGKINIFTDHAPELDLKAQISNSKIKVYPFQSVKLSGSLTVSGDQAPYLVAGDIDIDSALSKEKVLQGAQSTALKAVQYTPPPGTFKAGDYPLFKLKINVRAEKNIIVQNELFDAELKARLTIVNTLEAPRLLGNVDLVQGKMAFKGHNFQIQSMGANFDNPAVINPKVNLTARTEISGVKVQLYAAGTVDDSKNLKVELTSTPAMSESDILSLLTIGMTTNDTKRLSSSDLAAVQQGEAASLLLNSLDFNREIADKTGLQLQLDESVNPYVGASVFNRQTAGETSVAPKIVVRKQVTRDVDVSYGSTVGVGSGSEQEVNVELKVSPAASFIGVWDNYQSLDTGDRQTSYGLDFKLQKRFR